MLRRGSSARLRASVFTILTVTGVLIVQVGLEEQSTEAAFTRSSAKKFEMPTRVPGRSSLWALTLKEAPIGSSRQCWIGKDLNRAHPEVAFYEEAWP
eukprot:g10535.t1